MLAKLTLVLAVCVILIADYSDAYKLDVLSLGNRRREFYDEACEDHGGPHNPLDISGCEHFSCNDGTQQPIEHGTPCKKVLHITFGHCLNGNCLSPAEYLEETARHSSHDVE